MTGAFSSATGHCSGASTSCSVFRLAGTVGSVDDIAFTRCKFSCDGSRRAMYVDSGIWRQWDLAGCIILGIELFATIVGFAIAYRCGCFDTCCAKRVGPPLDPVLMRPIPVPPQPMVGGYGPFPPQPGPAFGPPLNPHPLNA